MQRERAKSGGNAAEQKNKAHDARYDARGDTERDTETAVVHADKIEGEKLTQEKDTQKEENI